MSDDKAQIAVLKGSELAIRKIVEQAILNGARRDSMEVMLHEIHRDVRHGKPLTDEVVDDESKQDG